MITHLDIDGFKSFKDFSVDFAPFTVIAGANASGKTNLFDALAFLKGIAEHGDLEKAMVGSRGIPLHLFTQFGPEDYAKEMRFAVDLLVPKSSIYLGSPRSVEHSTRLRYILVVGRNVQKGGRYQPYVKYEAVETLDEKTDDWINRYIPKKSKHAYLNGPSESTILYEYDDEKVEATIGRFIPNISKIGQVTTESAPELLSVRTVLQKLAFVDLSDRSLYADAHHPWLSQGKPSSDRLVDIVSHLKSKSLQQLKYLRKFVGTIIPEVSDIDVYKDKLGQETLVVYDRDRKMMTAGSLSAGTLRVILLSAHILLDDNTSLLIEEPENGIAPGRIHRIVDLLARMATDFDETAPSLRQLICTTHSPDFLDYVRANGSKLTVAYLALKRALITTIDDKRIKVDVTGLESIPLSKDSRTPDGLRVLTRAKDYFNRSQASVDA